jgi:hypothetical protein
MAEVRGIPSTRSTTKGTSRGQLLVAEDALWPLDVAVRSDDEEGDDMATQLGGVKEETVAR